LRTKPLTLPYRFVMDSLFSNVTVGNRLNPKNPRKSKAQPHNLRNQLWNKPARWRGIFPCADFRQPSFNPKGSENGLFQSGFRHSPRTQMRRTDRNSWYIVLPVVFRHARCSFKYDGKVFRDNRPNVRTGSAGEKSHLTILPRIHALLK